MVSETKNMNGESLWARIDARLAESDKKTDNKKDAAPRNYRWVVDAILPISMTIVAGIGVLLPESLTREARIALFTFALATILWSTTKLNAAYVALAVTIILIVSGGRPQEALFDSLATDVIWLMIGAFISRRSGQKNQSRGSFDESRRCQSKPSQSRFLAFNRRAGDSVVFYSLDFRQSRRCNAGFQQLERKNRRREGFPRSRCLSRRLFLFPPFAR